MHALGTRLKELRNEKGLTQKQLGEYIHKSKAAIGSYEQGVQTPPTDVLISLARLYHVSLDEIIGFERNITFSVDGLSEDQREVITMLLNEFTKPTGKATEISDAQMIIINKLIRIFIGRD